MTKQMKLRNSRLTRELVLYAVDVGCPKKSRLATQLEISNYCGFMTYGRYSHMVKFVSKDKVNVEEEDTYLHVLSDSMGPAVLMCQSKKLLVMCYEVEYEDGSTRLITVNMHKGMVIDERVK